MLLLFAASCLVPLLRKVRDDDYESKYVNDESFDHLFGKESIENTLSKDLVNKESEPNVKADNILKIQKQEENGGEIDEDVAGLEKADKAIKEDEHEKEDENEEEDEDNEEDKIEEGDEDEKENERGAEKEEGFKNEWGGGRSRKGEEEAEESDEKNLRGKIDGEKLELHEKEEDKRTEKNKEAATKNLQDVKEKVAAKEEGENGKVADENVGKGAGDKVEAKEEADEEGEQATVGGAEGKLKEEEEEERTEENEDRDNIENVDGKGKHKSKIEVNVPDDFDSQYKDEKKKKGVKITEKASKTEAEGEEEEEEGKSGDDMVSKQEEDPPKFPNHLEEKMSTGIKLMEHHTNDTIFHVNQSNKYPSHDDDRIAYQVLHQEAFDYF